MRRATIGLFLLGVLLLFAAPGETQAGTFGFFNPCAQVELTSTAARASADVKTTLGFGLDPATCGRFYSAQDRPGEWLGSDVIHFTPPEWQVGRGVTITDGDVVGEYKSEITLGLLNNACSNALNLNMVLRDGSLDQNDPVVPKPPGEANRLLPLADTPFNDSLPLAATKWPSYLTVWAERERIDLTKLRARIVGTNTSDVPGTAIVMNMMVFEPGTTAGVSPDPRLGYPTVVLFQDPTAPVSDSDPVDDICAPYWSEFTLNQNAPGINYRRNPRDGAYYFTTFVRPRPDADDDGIENALDPCPYDANVSGWDPRAPMIRDVTVGDLDVDGLPADCDPDTNNKSPCAAASGVPGADQDCDRYSNRGDNCPLVKNGKGQTPAEYGMQMDSDGDGIGDACDRNIDTGARNTVDGWYPGRCLTTLVSIGNGGVLGAEPKLMFPCSGDVEFAFSSDVDCDGDTDNVDLLAEMFYIAGQITTVCIDRAYRGCDDVIDPIDIVYFLRFLSGYSISSNCVHPRVPF